MWYSECKNVIQSRDVTFNETVMLSSGNDSIVSSIGATDQKDASNSMEMEVETVATQVRAANQPNKEAHVIEPGTISSDQP